MKRKDGTEPLPFVVYAIWRDGVRIVKVQRWRHTVRYPGEDRDSELSYCNNCGSPFIFGAPDNDAHDRCECGLPMGNDATDEKETQHDADVSTR